MPERVNIPQMSDEQRESLTNIMDVASMEMSETQSENLQSLAEAKAASVENIVGAEQMPTFRFTKTRPVVRDYKIGRNDPCPCGSGLKYKKCCLGSGKYESTHTV
jgi:preprotein translocase subunit SecA